MSEGGVGEKKRKGTAPWTKPDDRESEKHG